MPRKVVPERAGTSSHHAGGRASFAAGGEGQIASAIPDSQDTVKSEESEEEIAGIARICIEADRKL